MSSRLIGAARAGARRILIQLSVKLYYGDLPMTVLEKQTKLPYPRGVRVHASFFACQEERINVAARLSKPRLWVQS